MNNKILTSTLLLSLLLNSALAANVRESCRLKPRPYSDKFGNTGMLTHSGSVPENFPIYGSEKDLFFEITLSDSESKEGENRTSEEFTPKAEGFRFISSFMKRFSIRDSIKTNSIKSSRIFDHDVDVSVDEPDG